MTAGRPAKSISEHQANGTFRKDRHPGPSLPVEVPPMPPDLSPTAQARWNVIAEHVRFSQVVSRVDGEALRLLCESWALYLEAQDILSRDGITITESTAAGGARVKVHPAVQVRSDAQKQITGLLRQFGLTPAARTTIRPGGGGKSKAEGERVDSILKIRGA